jgi:L-asparaginase / beta-aspartyl-peptidase
MRYLFLLLTVICMTTVNAQKKPHAGRQNYVLVIHGGAGTILKRNMSPEKEKAYQEALQQALQAGHVILSKGGSALDAVEAAIRVMEDSPLFNAGKGAVFSNEGKNELDAAIMNGKTLAAARWPR